MQRWRFRTARYAALTGLLALVPLAGCGPQETTTSTSTTVTQKTELSPSGTTSAGKTFLIGMSQPNKGEPWRQAMYSQVEAAAAKHKNLKVVFADAGQNNAKQVSDVENLLQQKIDLLIISPNEAAPLTDVVAKAYDAGVPVIVLDRKVNGDKYTTWIGADNKAIGKQAGAYVADWCKAQKKNPCNILELRGWKVRHQRGSVEMGSGRG